MAARPDSPASRAVEFLKRHPEGATIGQLSTALAMHPSVLKGHLDLRIISSIGDLRRDGNRWFYVPPAGLSANKVAPKRPALPRGVRSGSGQVAGLREHRANGVYQQPRLLLRDGADDFRAVPSRVGDEHIPYHGA